MRRLEPIKAHLQKNHLPMNQKARVLSFEKLEFLKLKTADLLWMNMLVPSHNPIYGSPDFVVLKKGLKKFRMVVDLRLLNKYSRQKPLD